MKLSAEHDLSALYDHFRRAHPLQHARVCGTQNWSWVDSRAGDKTILLLPGFMGDAQTSFLYVLALKSHFRVITLSFPPSVSRVEALCDGLSALMDDLGIQQATILGGSTGGFIAQAFVRRYARRVGCLILTHTGLPALERVRVARAYLWLLRIIPYGLLQRLALASVHGYFPKRTPAHAFWRARFREILRGQNRTAMWNRFTLMADFHSHYRFHRTDLSGWQGRMLLMEMPRDHLIAPEEQVAMRELYPKATVRVFSETVHYDSVERPEEQIRVIIDFLLNA